MILEKRLYELCLENGREDIYSKWINIKEETCNKLRTVSNYFPHFSTHDETHSRTIAMQIGNLLGIERINKLSLSDILMMLLCFYKHDIGMALEYEEIYNMFHSEDFGKKIEEYANNQTSDLNQVAKRLQRFKRGNRIQDYETSIEVYNDVILIIEDVYRRNHAKRSAKKIMIEDNLKETLHERCQKLLADICELHQCSIEKISQLPLKENGIIGDHFHPRFVAAMLCLGDLLDLDTDRFDEAMMKATTPFPKLSSIHLKKHKSVYHYLVDENVIEVSADINDIEVYRMMRRWMDWIEEVCNYISLHWGEIVPLDFGIAPRLTKCELKLNQNTNWLPFSDLRYKISQKRVFELFRGGHIYKDKFICIREIIQNAIDATMLRIFEEILQDNKNFSEYDLLKKLKKWNWEFYSITGLIKKGNDSNIEISVRDRGIGLSVNEVLQIASVSNARSEERENIISQMPIWYRPSGIFGMGLFSVFLLSDQFVIITKTVNEKAKKITFQNAIQSDGFITIEDYNEYFEQGTKIEFTINNEDFKPADFGYPEYYFIKGDLSTFIIKEIEKRYNNQLTDGPLNGKKAEHEMINYVQVDIEAQLKNDIRKILHYEPMFTDNKLEFIEIRNGVVLAKKFHLKLNCYIECKFDSIIYVRKENDGQFIGRMFSGKRRWRNGMVFYRNAFVQNETMYAKSIQNISLLPYVDWKFNILDSSADKVLELSRNCIKSDYINQYYYKLFNVLERTIKLIIDYMIKQVKEVKNDVENAAVVLIFFQFSRQFHYKADEFYRSYTEMLKKISVNNYFIWSDQGENKEEIALDIDFLKNNVIYFVIEEIEGVSDENIVELDNEQLYDLNIAEEIHIINHRADKVFVCKNNNRFLKVVKTVPFECNSPWQLFDIDNYSMLENLIYLIYEGYKVIPAVRGYEKLVSIKDVDSEVVRYGAEIGSYYIEMPFGEYIVEMKEKLSKDGFIKNAYENFYKRIESSESLNDIITHLQGIKRVGWSDIKEDYCRLIKWSLKLLEKSKNREFNLFIMNKLKLIDKNKYAIYDNVETNKYIAYQTFFEKAN